MEEPPCSSSSDEIQKEGPTPPAHVDACVAHSNDAVERKLMARIEAQVTEDQEIEDKHVENSKKVAFMISITFLFFVVELTVGFINRSIALLADSYHMLSDVMALTVALICLQISRRKSKKNGFGWVRAEVLGALVNGVFLLAMCFTISLESVGRLIHTNKMSHPLQVLTVGIIGLLINLVGIKLFHGGHGHSHGGAGHGHSHGGGGHGHSHEGKGHSHGGHGHSHDHKDEHCDESPEDSVHREDKDELVTEVPKGKTARSLSHLSNEVSHNLSMIVGSGSKQHLALRLVNLDETAPEDEYDDDSDSDHKKKMRDAENLNMRGVFLHIISDAIGSVFVIVTAALAYWAPESLNWLIVYLDPLLSLLLVSLICFSAYRLVKETAAIILGNPPAFVDFKALKRDITKIRGVASATDISVWTLVANRHIATAKIEFCSPVAYDKAMPKIRKLFHGVGIHSLTLQPTFSSSQCLISSPPAADPIPESPEESVPHNDSTKAPLLKPDDE